MKIIQTDQGVVVRHYFKWYILIGSYLKPIRIVKKIVKEQ